MLEEFKDVFTGIGKMPGKHHNFFIVIDENVRPVVHPPRRVPFALEIKLKRTLDNLESKGIIERRDDPTDWVNSLLIVEKRDGSLRLCLDPKDLNLAIKREHFHIPTCEDILPKLVGMSVCTIIDQKDGFYQIELDDESKRLCTFNTPFGRYSIGHLEYHQRLTCFRRSVTCRKKPNC